ncbi:hypothetical protein PJI20_21730 [Mycobacterium kansasii]|nr:hypothetical protein [Mycobacterium attenuatum]
MHHPRRPDSASKIIPIWAKSIWHSILTQTKIRELVDNNAK